MLVSLKFKIFCSTQLHKIAFYIHFPNKCTPYEGMHPLLGMVLQRGVFQTRQNF